jgi:uncharacterized membrane protein (DUF106 family)
MEKMLRKYSAVLRELGKALDMRGGYEAVNGQLLYTIDKLDELQSHLKMCIKMLQEYDEALKEIRSRLERAVEIKNLEDKEREIREVEREYRKAYVKLFKSFIESGLLLFLMAKKIYE